MDDESNEGDARHGTWRFEHAANWDCKNQTSLERRYDTTAAGGSQPDPRCAVRHDIRRVKEAGMDGPCERPAPGGRDDAAGGGLRQNDCWGVPPAPAPSTYLPSSVLPLPSGSFDGWYLWHSYKHEATIRRGRDHTFPGN